MKILWPKNCAYQQCWGCRAYWQWWGHPTGNAGDTMPIGNTGGTAPIGTAGGTAPIGTDSCWPTPNGTDNCQMAQAGWHWSIKENTMVLLEMKYHGIVGNEVPWYC